MVQNNPILSQAMLNGCMEALRANDRIRAAGFGMFGALMAAGCPPDEVFLRVSANNLLLGMFLQRRVSSS